MSTAEILPGLPAKNESTSTKHQSATPTPAANSSVMTLGLVDFEGGHFRQGAALAGDVSVVSLAACVAGFKELRPEWCLAGHPRMLLCHLLLLRRLLPMFGGVGF